MIIYNDKIVELLMHSFENERKHEWQINEYSVLSVFSMAKHMRMQGKKLKTCIYPWLKVPFYKKQLFFRFETKML